VAVFGIGDITAVFHWCGTTPVASDWSNRRASGAAKIGAPRRLDKFWQHQSVKFDFTTDLTLTRNRSEEVIK